VPIVEVFTGAMQHTAVRLADGRVFAWGLNNVGQLGNGGGAGNFRRPTQVPFPPGLSATQVRVTLGSDVPTWLPVDPWFSESLSFSLFRSFSLPPNVSPQ
jgi:hypothetical protein